MDKNVVVGLPIVHKISDLYSNEQIDLYTEETFLPRILVEIGFFKSNSEVRRNRPDLVLELSKIDFIFIKVGKKHLCITVGKPIEGIHDKTLLNDMIELHNKEVT